MSNSYIAESNFDIAESTFVKIKDANRVFKITACTYDTVVRLPASHLPACNDHVIKHLLIAKLQHAEVQAVHAQESLKCVPLGLVLSTKFWDSPLTELHGKEYHEHMNQHALWSMLNLHQEGH
jgi:hypothetical protein